MQTYDVLYDQGDFISFLALWRHIKAGCDIPLGKHDPPQYTSSMQNMYFLKIF